LEPWLYLDTARLGLMSPAAQRAHEDFARLAGEAGAAIQIEDLVKHGFEALDPRLRRRAAGLSIWNGIESFKRLLQRLVPRAAADEELRLLFAARSAELMKLAAMLLCRRCRHILVTDLGWPPYHDLLARECRRTNRRLTTVAVAEDVLQGRLTAEELASRVEHAYRQHGCDGLFLVAVSNTGGRQPIEAIAQAVRPRCRMLVVDGAQEFCHVQRGSTLRVCDLYLTSCHKWLGGYHPMAVACYGRRRSRRLIETVLERSLRSRSVDDPLLRFIRSVEQGSCGSSGETVNLSPLFSSAGAVEDQLRADTDRLAARIRLDNADQVVTRAAATCWQPQEPDASLRTGIVLLKHAPTRGAVRSGETYRRAFQRRGVALSAYDNGLLRLSMPAQPLSGTQLSLLEGALQSVV
jgi:hypothetical protein